MLLKCNIWYSVSNRENLKNRVEYYMKNDVSMLSTILATARGD